MVRPSAVIVPYRTAPRFEIFWSKRQPFMTFLGGFHAFFGGSLEPADADFPMTQADPWRACAARELLEEGGIWIGVDGPVMRPAQERKLSPEHLIALLKDHQRPVQSEAFKQVGHWITPEFAPLRYESRFFAVDLTTLANADALSQALEPAELASGDWITPEDALRAWRLGEVFVSQPIRYLLEAFATAGHPDVFVDASAVKSPLDYAETLPGIYVVPLKSPTIPPATHTNCFLVGTSRFVVVDPGGNDDAELALLEATIDELLQRGGRLEAIVLTHHHPDHVAAVDRLKSLYAVGVWGHPRTAQRLGRSFERELHDGDVLDLGQDSLEVVFTPGHADGHLSFHHRRTEVTLVGDLVAQHGTILIDPEDGHMGDYLDSLQTIAELNPRALLPAHGWVIVEPLPRLAFYRHHRLEREEKVLAALRQLGQGTAAEITPIAYADSPQHVWPIAERSVTSHLIHLVELGKVFQHGDRFEFRTSYET